MTSAVIQFYFECFIKCMYLIREMQPILLMKKLNKKLHSVAKQTFASRCTMLNDQKQVLFLKLVGGGAMDRITIRFLLLFLFFLTFKHVKHYSRPREIKVWTMPAFKTEKINFLNSGKCQMSQHDEKNVVKKQTNKQKQNKI